MATPMMGEIREPQRKSARPAVELPKPDANATTKPEPASIVLELAGTDQRWMLNKDAITIGREPSCDVVIDRGSVARVHARVRIHASSCEVADLGTSNGTLVNGRRVVQGELCAGDTIQLGPDGAVLRVAVLNGQPAKPATVKAGEDLGLAERAATSSRSGVLGGAPPPATLAPAFDAVTKSLSRMKLFVALSVVANVAMLAVVLFQFYQTQNTMDDFRSRSQNAVQLLQPQLNQRLNRFEARLDAEDIRQRQALDAFDKVRRDLPAIMDQYAKDKMAFLKREMQVPPAH